MTVSRRFARRSVALLAIATTIGLTGVAVAADDRVTASGDQVQSSPTQLPAGLEEGDRLFVNNFRGYIVQITDGRLELIEPTGWDSCYFLYRKQVLGYPC